MDAVALSCGNASQHGQWASLTERSDLEVREVPATPGKNDVDPVLRELAGRRLLVLGDDADLAAVALRLLRADRLGEVVVGFLPTDPESAVAELWGLPTRPDRATEVAMGGEPEPVPLIRDDVGGVLVGLGVLGPLQGVAYCDDERVLRGGASRLEVSPDPAGGPGLVVRVVRRGLLGKRVTSTQGRAVQIGSFVATKVVKDGVPHPRPMDKWTWYRHTEDLRLVRGLA
ncbi:hypothetical protein LX15_005819 [Streptoalloteichus tenebrarius]|uniref:DAGKc domain-containing protein n=1 Tax=Streptoalloteichus tenebrarius (strain ATCC 17920 / DSM 40477 / JCM 4838 / CBS 697.72 / NBRC 16177 / NCIMB 11028 / NRRL B-12390 / A12253. 1 / ISP 5477) TaxID=1933 RepID=A0ABT1I2S2_STRSD|nr:hypothetical protein [Streptoalloteichus tenebrarius]MCP2262087.1 hypothetical protein [Streptoalloteichus tenebrarius]BFF02241.1 hypothetical protein GCM10020241_39160 [Streptoalloteichus tenebrarius]